MLAECFSPHIDKWKIFLSIPIKITKKGFIKKEIRKFIKHS